MILLEFISFGLNLLALKAFIKPFEAPQRSVKIKIQVNFYLLQLSKMHGTGRVKNENNFLDETLKAFFINF